MCIDLWIFNKKKESIKSRRSRYGYFYFRNGQATLKLSYRCDKLKNRRKICEEKLVTEGKNKDFTQQENQLLPCPNKAVMNFSGKNGKWQPLIAGIQGLKS